MLSYLPSDLPVNHILLQQKVYYGKTLIIHYIIISMRLLFLYTSS